MTIKLIPPLLLILLGLIVGTSVPAADLLQILDSFTNGGGSSSLIVGTNGNMYGTSSSGGTNGVGSIFQLTATGAFTTLASLNGTNGSTPIAGVVQGVDGNFYGTSEYGGISNYGTIFRVTPSGTVTLLYSFTNGVDGLNPNGVVQHPNGNLYATTSGGKQGGAGTIMELAGGIATVLVSFNGTNGSRAGGAPLVVGTNGYLYGTTSSGGKAGQGTFFSVSPSGSFSSLYSFTNGLDGASPNRGLTLGTDGKFYGTTFKGGPADGGPGFLFSVTPAGNLSVVYRFLGLFPVSGLTQGRDGNFYGLANYEFALGNGTFYEITRGGQAYNLYSFTNGADGNPSSAPVQGSDGNFYGTAATSNGGWNIVRYAQPTVFGWGEDFNGEIAPIPPLSNVVAIAAGAEFSMALQANGTVVIWGFDGDGETNVPSGLSNVMAIAAGGYHILALRTNGTVAAWGDNSYGETNVPPGLSNIVAIAAGYEFSLALRTNGTVVAWGGTGETNLPPKLSNVVAIAAGYDFGVALQRSGTVVAWGDDTYGQTNVPPGLSNVMAIAAGGFHGLALQSNGTVMAWGYNSDVETNVPPGLSNVMAIAAGDYHNLALLSNGTIVAWGENYSGETNVPSGLSNVVAIADGADFSLSITYSPPSPTNDNFANAALITGTNVTVFGANVRATEEPGEQGSTGNTGGGSVWYTWTPTQNYTVTLQITNSTFTTLLGIYTGGRVSNLFAIVNALDTSETFSATAGTQYYIAVDGADGEQGSFAFTLNAVIPPVNDDFTNATLLTGTSISVDGSNAGATLEPGEQKIASNSGGASVWYIWTPTQSGQATVSTPSGTLFSIFAVYTGGYSVSNLILNAYNEAPQVAIFSAAAGTPYYIKVDGYNGQEGTFTLSLNECIPPEPNPPVFTTSQTTEADGIHVIFCADIQGANLGPYHWSVKSPSDYLNSINDGTCFEVVVSPTEESSVTVNMTVSNPCGTSGGNSPPVPTCGVCLSRGSPNLLTGTTGGGSAPTNSTVNCGTVSANAIWYKMIASGTGLVTVSTEGSSNETLLAIYKGVIGAMTNIACYNGFTSSNLESRVTFGVINSNEYWIAVDSHTNSTAKLRVATGFAPTIQNFALMPDGSFMVQSSTAPPITYELLASSTLTTNTNAWSVVLATNLTLTSPNINYRDTNVHGVPQRFYRLGP